MEVYETLELRQSIFSYLDYGTLAGMLRLEQAVTCSIAGILYRTVHISQLPKMSRANVRISDGENSMKVDADIE